MSDEDRVLRTWKEVGAYVGVSDQTAKRYHKKYNMPVRRLPCGTVFASSKRIREWLIEGNKKNWET